MDTVLVIDQDGRTLSATSSAKADRLLAAGKARLIGADPATIQLNYAVPGAPTRSGSLDQEPSHSPGPDEAKSVLVHICCAPCTTYTVARLRELGLATAGYWYNPNIQPFSEHERRRETLAQYAQRIDLPVIWEPGYDVVAFFRVIHGQEQFRARCMRCYQLRMERTAAAAAWRGFDCITSTLLISPYQDQAAIRRIGERAAAQHGVQFFFQNFRQGWAEHFAVVRQEQLYSQRYCGCVYSEWEALDRQAWTLTDGAE